MANTTLSHALIITFVLAVKHFIFKWTFLKEAWHGQYGPVVVTHTRTHTQWTHRPKCWSTCNLSPHLVQCHAVWSLGLQPLMCLPLFIDTSFNGSWGHPVEPVRLPKTADTEDTSITDRCTTMPAFYVSAGDPDPGPDSANTKHFTHWACSEPILLSSLGSKETWANLYRWQKHRSPCNRKWVIQMGVCGSYLFCWDVRI